MIQPPPGGFTLRAALQAVYLRASQALRFLTSGPRLPLRTCFCRRGHSDAGAAAALGRASKKRDQTRRGWRVACCRGRACSRSMRAPALPEHSMEWLTFSGSRLQGGGHLAAGVRDSTAPAGCVAGWRWTCPRFGEALHHITRCIILRWSFSGRHRPCRRTPHRGARQDQAALCDTSVM